MKLHCTEQHCVLSENVLSDFQRKTSPHPCPIKTSLAANRFVVVLFLEMNRLILVLRPISLYLSVYLSLNLCIYLSLSLSIYLSFPPISLSFISRYHSLSLYLSKNRNKSVFFHFFVFYLLRWAQLSLLYVARSEDEALKVITLNIKLNLIHYSIWYIPQLAITTTTSTTSTTPNHRKACNA